MGIALGITACLYRHLFCPCVIPAVSDSLRFSACILHDRGSITISPKSSASAVVNQTSSYCRLGDYCRSDYAYISSNQAKCSARLREHCLSWQPDNIKRWL